MPLLLVGFFSLAVFVFIVRPEPPPANPTVLRPEDFEESKPEGSRNAVGDTRELRYTSYDGQSVWLCLDESVWLAMDDGVFNARYDMPGGVVVVRQLKDAGTIKAYPIGTRVRLTASAGPKSWKVTVLDGTNGEGWARDFQLGAPSLGKDVYIALEWTAARAYVIAAACAIAILLPLGITVMVGAIRRHRRSIKPKPDRGEL
jgi:hypothetical protein